MAETLEARTRARSEEIEAGLRRTERAIVVAFVCTVLSVAFALVAICSSAGCSSSDQLPAIRKAWDTYRRAVVPNPAYGPDGVACVVSLDRSLDALIHAGE